MPFADIATKSKRIYIRVFFWVSTKTHQDCWDEWGGSIQVTVTLANKGVGSGWLVGINNPGATGGFFGYQPAFFWQWLVKVRFFFHLGSLVLLICCFFFVFFWVGLEIDAGQEQVSFFFFKGLLMCCNDWKHRIFFRYMIYIYIYIYYTVYIPVTKYDMYIAWSYTMLFFFAALDFWTHSSW